MRITMDAEGRLVIPAEIREAAGLGSGVALEVRVRNGTIELEKVEMEAAAEAERPGLAAERSGFTVVRGRQAGGRVRTASEAAAEGTDRPQLDLLIRMAIAHRRVVDLVYADRLRRVEPHDYGLRNGEAQLLVFQRSVEARSKEAIGWRSLKLVSISDFHVLDEAFPGGRPADRHIDWDQLFASVSREPF